MSLSLLFWICMLLLLVLGGYACYPLTRFSGVGLLLFLALLALGWAQFGPPIK